MATQKMILLFVLFVIVGVSFGRSYRRHGALPLLTVALSLLFAALGYAEHRLTGLPWFRSDETYFLEEGATLSAANFDYADFARLGWIAVNGFAQRIDVFAGGLSVKLLSVPILFFAMRYFWIAFDKRNGVFWMPIVLPYLCITAVQNLRDTAILFLTVALCVTLYERTTLGIFRSAVVAGLLLISRPFLLAVILLGFAIERLWNSRHYVRRLALPRASGLKLATTLVIGISALAVAWPIVSSLVNQYDSYWTYLLAGRHDEIGEEVLGELSGSTSVDFVVGALRYAVTPLPTSLVLRLARGGAEQWGMIDDAVRIMNQLGYFALLALLVVRRRRVLRALKDTTGRQRLILFSLGMMWPIYSWQLFGVTHQRLKLPLQIVVYLLVLIGSHAAVGRWGDNNSAQGQQRDA